MLCLRKDRYIPFICSLVLLAGSCGLDILQVVANSTKTLQIDLGPETVLRRNMDLSRPYRQNRLKI